MATSILEQITALVKTQLETVTTAGGYEVQLTRVIRPTKAMDDPDQEPDHLVAYLQQGSPSIDEANSVAGNPRALAWVQPYDVTVLVRPSDKDKTPIDTAINQARSSVEKAIAAGLQPGTDLHALIMNWELNEPELWSIDDGSFDGINISFNVTYRVDEDDPYTSRA